MTFKKDFSLPGSVVRAYYEVVDSEVEYGGNAIVGV